MPLFYVVFMRLCLSIRLLLLEVFGILSSFSNTIGLYDFPLWTNRGIPTYDIDGLVQERRNSIANTLELCHSWTNPLIYALEYWVTIGLDMACHVIHTKSLFKAVKTNYQ